MKSIPMHQLKVGDIFTSEMKVIGREAFEVLELHKEKTVLCQSRNLPFPRPKTKRVKGTVYLLRNLND